jgi:hypothetical protein
MRITIPSEKEREIAPPGSHYAVCYTVCDLGSQPGPYGTKHQIYLAWELPEETTSRGKPHVLGKFYNLVSDARGALRQDLESWFGKPLTAVEIANLDLVEDLLGRTATLGVIRDARQDGKPRAAITSVMLPPKGKPVMSQTLSDPIIFGLDGDFDRRAYEALPQWLQTIVARSPEYPRASTGMGLVQEPPIRDGRNGRFPPADPDLDDSIPF